MIGIILAGGHGTRLKPLTDHTPKSLIKINGRPILDHIICYMRCAGITEISCISDMQKPVRPWLETHEPQIRIVDQDDPIGTGQAVHLALSSMNKKQGVLVMLGDIIPHRFSVSGYGSGLPEIFNFRHQRGGRSDPMCCCRNRW